MALVQATVSTIEIHCAIGQQTYTTDQYFSLGYVEHSIEARLINKVSGTATSTTAVSVSVDAGVITAASTSIQSNLNIGEQVYFDTDTYLEQGYITTSFDAGIIKNIFVDIDLLSISMNVGKQQYIDNNDYIVSTYFEGSVESNVETVTANIAMSITATVAPVDTNYHIPMSANLDIQSRVGSLYTEIGYIGTDYFQESVTAQNQAFATVEPSIAGTVNLSANADFVADINISATVTVTPSAGFTADGEVIIPITATVTCDPNEIQAVNASLDITASTSLAANAIALANVSSNITLTTGIQANAESTGVINIDSLSDLLVDCQVFRINPRYTLIIPQETRLNTIQMETRQVLIPTETRELEFEY
jgi:hypothetical protein